MQWSGQRQTDRPVDPVGGRAARAALRRKIADPLHAAFAGSFARGIFRSFAGCGVGRRLRGGRRRALRTVGVRRRCGSWFLRRTRRLAAAAARSSSRGRLAGSRHERRSRHHGCRRNHAVAFGPQQLLAVGHAAACLPTLFGRATTAAMRLARIRCCRRRIGCRSMHGMRNRNSQTDHEIRRKRYAAHDSFAQRQRT